MWEPLRGSGAFSYFHSNLVKVIRFNELLLLWSIGVRQILGIVRGLFDKLFEIFKDYRSGWLTGSVNDSYSVWHGE